VRLFKLLQLYILMKIVKLIKWIADFLAPEEKYKPKYTDTAIEYSPFRVLTNIDKNKKTNREIFEHAKKMDDLFSKTSYITIENKHEVLLKMLKRYESDKLESSSESDKTKKLFYMKHDGGIN
jgi:hypothetical protein